VQHFIFSVIRRISTTIRSKSTTGFSTARFRGQSTPIPWQSKSALVSLLLIAI